MIKVYLHKHTKSPAYIFRGQLEQWDEVSGNWIPVREAWMYEHAYDIQPVDAVLGDPPTPGGLDWREDSTILG